MDEKISLKALEDYSDDFASKVAASFFSTKEKITGPEILKVTEIQQINLLVIQELLHAWQLESNKLKSPFFDYSAPEVVAALTKFQNLISNHISISRENFQPLLRKAVRQTLYLVLDPYDFFSDTLDQGHGGPIRMDELRSLVRYMRINRTPLERLIETFDAQKKATVSGKEAFAALDHILEEVNFTPEDVEPYLEQMSRVVPVTLNSFYEQVAVEPVAEPVAEPVQPKPEAKPVPVPTPAPEVKAKPVAEEKPAVKQPEPAKSPGVQTSLYTAPAKTGTTLAEDFQKIKKIKDTLTINQKFMFTKILFNGDFELFSDAIERLDQLDNMSQANHFISNNYPEWNPETEEYQEFMEIVQRRFS